ncbi:hypothetical protein BC332_17157 [Capsicum chinense]|nr:hypothetical protein BC332_17157 [Capsicum chinense]
MNNPPSFSLGITQLDATVQDIPLGFVSATFDEHDPDWAENRSKYKNDPVTMNKLKDKAASKSKKSTSKESKKKFDDSGRPRLPKSMKYRIDKVPPHSLHMGSLCNCAFEEEIKEYFGEDVLGAFRNVIFSIFLYFPWCNWIGKISKCLLMLEIQQDNKDELHVWVEGKILKFTMLEFAIIIGLKCTGNIDDYMHTSSSKSVLMSRYFSYNKGAITRSKLVTRVQMGNFDNAERLQVHSCGFDAASQRARYASLLWHYGVKKANEGYTSDNGDSSRLKKSVIEEIKASAIVTLE